MLDILFLLIDTVAGVLGTALLLRAYMLWNGISAFNPLGQFAYALTDWLVMPLRRLVPLPGRLDWPSLFAAYLVALAALALLGLVTGTMAFAGPPFPVQALLMVLRWVMYLIFGLTLLYALMSWINPQAPLAPVIGALVRPMLAPFRRFIPLIGGIDLSPLALIVLAQIGLVIIGSLGAPGR